MATSRLEGMDDLHRALKKAGTLAPVALASAMVVEQEKVMAAAKKVAPVAPDGGVLRASGTVLPPEVSGSRITVASGFGGAAKDYALAVHEHLSKHSPPSWKNADGGAKDINWNVSGSGPKFLEGPFNERKPAMIRNLAVGVGKALKRLGK